MKIYSLQTEFIDFTSTSITILKFKITKKEQKETTLEIMRLIVNDYCADISFVEEVNIPLNRIVTVTTTSIKGKIAIQVGYNKPRRIDAAS